MCQGHKESHYKVLSLLKIAPWTLWTIWKSHANKILCWVSLVAQRKTICLPMQETQIRSPVQEGPPRHTGTKPLRHDTEPAP